MRSAWASGACRVWLMREAYLHDNGGNFRLFTKQSLISGRGNETELRAIPLDPRRVCGPRKLATIDAVDLKALEDFRAARKVNVLTRTKELQILRHFFAYCMKRGWILGSPAKDLSTPRNVKPDETESYRLNDVGEDTGCVEQHRPRTLRTAQGTCRHTLATEVLESRIDHF
jgi:hypothetical protein